jgi:hypothetical protein
MGRKGLLGKEGKKGSFWRETTKIESQVHIEQTSHERKLLDGEKCQETKRIFA